MRRLILLPVVAAGLFACGCAPRDEAPGPPVLAWTVRDVQRSWGSNPADTTRDVWVSFTLPEFSSAPGGPAAAESLNAWTEQALLAGSPGDSALGSPEDIAAQMIANYQSLRREVPGMRAPWFYENEVRVAWDSLATVAMVSSADRYTGGAHGSAVKRWGVLDTHTGRRLRVSDLIESGGLDSLSRLAEAAFRRTRGIAPEARLDHEGFWFHNGRFTLSPNFGLERGGLVFHYNPYDVAPYAMGPTTVVVRWDEAAPLLRADGPLAALRRN